MVVDVKRIFLFAISATQSSVRHSLLQIRRQPVLPEDRLLAPPVLFSGTLGDWEHKAAVPSWKVSTASYLQSNAMPRGFRSIYNLIPATH